MERGVGVPRPHLGGGDGCLCSQQQSISGGSLLIKCHPSEACQGAKETHCGSSTPRTQDVPGSSQGPRGMGASSRAGKGREGSWHSCHVMRVPSS